MITIKKYKREGKTVFLDLVRNIFVLATKEEIIRQNVLNYLINNWCIPTEFIRVEENMSYYKKDARHRADIIVLHPKSYEPLILFEIKSHDVYICDDTLQQAIKYNIILNCKFICLTNEINEMWYIYKNGKAIQIEKPSTYHNLLKSNIKYIEEFIFVRPTLNECSNKDIIDEYINDYFIIGEDTPFVIHPFIVNFYGMLIENKKHIKEIM